MNESAGNLEKFLDKTLHWHSRINAGQGLENNNSDATVEAIIKLLYDSSDIYDVREVASRILIKTSNPAGSQALLQAISNRDLPEDTRTCAMVGLYQNLPEEFQTQLLSIADDDDESDAVRGMAITVLSAKAVEAVIPILTRLIDAPFMRQTVMNGRNLAVDMLMKWKTPETRNVVLDWLHRALEDESLDLNTREWAAQDMRTLADPRSEDILIRMIDSDAVQQNRLSAGNSRNHAVEALRELGSEKALQAIAEWEKRPKQVPQQRQKSNLQSTSLGQFSSPPIKTSELEIKSSYHLYGKRIELETNLSPQEIASRLQTLVNRRSSPVQIERLFEDGDPSNVYLRASIPRTERSRNYTTSQSYARLEGYFRKAPNAKRTSGDLRYSVQGMFALYVIIFIFAATFLATIMEFGDRDARIAITIVVLSLGGTALTYVAYSVYRGFKDGDLLIAFIEQALK